MDSGRFRGFSGCDFCSCGRQNFACVKPNLVSVFTYLSRLEFAGKGGTWGLSKLKRFLSCKLRKHCYLRSIVDGEETTRLWFDLSAILDSYLSWPTIYWTGDMFNICLQFVYLAYSFDIYQSCHFFSILSMFVIIL